MNHTKAALESLKLHLCDCGYASSPERTCCCKCGKPFVVPSVPTKVEPMHPLEYLRRNGWRDYEAPRRIWIDPETAQHMEEADALRTEFKRRTGTVI